MKIMFYYGSMYRGGSQRVISTLANNFVQRGDEVSIMVTDSRPTGYKLDERVRYINQCAEATSSGLVSAVRNNLHHLALTRKYLREIRPDVVFCFDSKMVAEALLTKAFLGIKTIGFEPSNPYSSHRGFFWESMRQVATPFADGYIFSVEGVRQYYPRLTRKKSALIPTGVFAETIPATVPPLHQRPGKKVCAVGRLHFVKGFDVLIRAFARFHQKFPDYTLHIYGEGPERTGLEELIRQLEADSYIMLEGYVQDVPAKLCENTMFVLSSSIEGMPNALIEALACGLACVSTNCNFGPADLITDGENGLLVPVGDVEALAQALERIAADPALAERLAQNALKIRETHAMEKICGQFHDYITAIVRP